MIDTFSKVKRVCLPTKNGFSLVELLIVMAIMVIMAGVLLVSRSESRPVYDVEAGARQVAAQLRVLQNEALSGKMIGNVIACEMRFNTNPGDATKSYKTGYYCANTLIPNSEQKFLIGKNATNKSVSLAGDYYVKFTPPQATILSDLPVIGAARAISITSADGTKTSLVCVYDTGRILETKDAVCP